MNIADLHIHTFFSDGDLSPEEIIEESISNHEIRWTAKNLFWVDPEDHYVWKSIQYISPKLPSFTLQIAKRPSA